MFRTREGNRMKARTLVAVAGVVALIATVPGSSIARTRAAADPRATRHIETSLKGFVPAVAASQRLSRYYVVMDAPSVADQVRGGRTLTGFAERHARTSALAAQAGALAQARSLGGQVVFRDGTLINAFSAVLSPAAAQQLANRADVASVQPVSIVTLDNSTSVPFIGAPKVWNKFGARGQGMTLALVDTGIDYTHKDFGGSGNPADYENNDPNVVEPGTFPTKKVIGGFDFVGSNYDVLDADTSDDIPRPDFDPLDRDGHGTHTGGTCCGIGVPGKVGAGVAPNVKILAYKVWDVGNSTDDVLVAAYERAVDPNQDGDTSDHADVLSFSGGVDYGTLNSVEAVAAERVVDLGTVFVASAGNSGNQPAGGSAYITGTPANARGVISVAASVDRFVAQPLSLDTPAPPPHRQRHHRSAGLVRGDRHRHHRPGYRRSRVRYPGRPGQSRADGPDVLLRGRCGLRWTHRAHLQGFDGGRRLRRHHEGVLRAGGERRRCHLLERVRWVPVRSGPGRPRGRGDGARGHAERERLRDARRHGQSRRCDQQLQHGPDHRHDPCRPRPDPGLRGLDDGLHLRRACTAHERPEARHLRSRRRYHVRRCGHR